MPLSIAFWVTMLVALLIGVWTGWPFNLRTSAGGLVLFILLCMIGYKVFGSPIQ